MIIDFCTLCLVAIMKSRMVILPFVLSYNCLAMHWNKSVKNNSAVNGTRTTILFNCQSLIVIICLILLNFPVKRSLNEYNYKIFKINIDLKHSFYVVASQPVPSAQKTPCTGNSQHAIKNYFICPYHLNKDIN